MRPRRAYTIIVARVSDDKKKKIVNACETMFKAIGIDATLNPEEEFDLTS